MFSYTLAFSMFCVNQKDESFYTVSWACNIDGCPFLVAGGINGILRVIDAGKEKIHKVVNEIFDSHFTWLNKSSCSFSYKKCISANEFITTI